VFAIAAVSVYLYEHDVSGLKVVDFSHEMAEANALKARRRCLL
jgi:hypothetical protein